MSISNSKANKRAKRPRAPAGAADAAARGKRARDHLARKRRQERQRLARDRWRAENSENRALVRGALTPILLAFSFAVGVLAASPLFEFFVFSQTSLERIAVQGAFALSPLAIVQAMGVEAGRPLDSIDPAKLREAIAAEPWIESARALRLPTGTLVISVVERQALARWQKSPSLDIELIDQRGDRFSGEPEPGGPLPLVRGPIERGHSLPTSAMEILSEMQRYASLTKDPSAMTLYLPSHDLSALEEQSGYVLQIGEEGPRALLGKQFLSQRVARLAALLESEESKLQKASWIDLRYADRAVLRNEPASG
jgi:cell division septal protein FtsQ